MKTYSILCAMLLTACTTAPTAWKQKQTMLTAATTAQRHEMPAVMPIFIRNAVASRITPMAQAQARIYMDDKGCMRLGSDTAPLIIWHHQSRLEYVDGQVRIFNGLDNTSASIGDEVRLDGGEYGSKPEFVTPKIPDVCAGHGYWIAGPLIKA